MAAANGANSSGLEQPQLPSDQTSFEGRAGDAEKSLANFWSHVLGIDQIDRDDDLFDLGATSLALVMVLTAVDEEMNINVDMEAMFMAPTIAAQARLVEAAIASRDGSPA